MMAHTGVKKKLTGHSHTVPGKYRIAILILFYAVQNCIAR